MFENADLIHQYTRADAIRDGALIDVSATAREAGFKFPVALTAAVWTRDLDAARALELGFRADASFEDIIRNHIVDELEGRAPFIAAGGPFGIIDHGVDRPALWSVQALNPNENS